MERFVTGSKICQSDANWLRIGAMAFLGKGWYAFLVMEAGLIRRWTNAANREFAARKNL